MTGQKNTTINGDKFVTHKHLYIVLGGVNTALISLAAIMWTIVLPVGQREFIQRQDNVDTRMATREKHVDEQIVLIRADIKQRWMLADRKLESIDAELKKIMQAIVRFEARMPP